MQGRFRRLAITAALILVLPVTLGAAPAVQPAGDLRESYELLSTTYYSKVDTQKMLDGARQALADEIHRRGLRVSVPQFHDQGSTDANVSQIATAIARMESATHQPSTLLTYEAIGGMAKSLGDRYTTFFTPDEYRQFNQALDPEKISGIGVLIQPDEESKCIRAYYVVPGTPAEKAGLQSGDVFLNVDGVSMKGYTSDQATKVLRGKSGKPPGSWLPPRHEQPPRCG